MSHVVIRGFQVERSWGRVSGVFEHFAFRAALFVALIALTLPTHAVTLVFAPIVMGIVRNRPMTGIFIWSLLGWTIIGWFIALYKALGNR